MAGDSNSDSDEGMALGCACEGGASAASGDTGSKRGAKSLNLCSSGDSSSEVAALALSDVDVADDSASNAASSSDMALSSSRGDAEWAPGKRCDTAGSVLREASQILASVFLNIRRLPAGLCRAMCQHLGVRAKRSYPDRALGKLLGSATRCRGECMATC